MYDSALRTPHSEFGFRIPHSELRITSVIRLALGEAPEVNETGSGTPVACAGRGDLRP